MPNYKAPTVPADCDPTTREIAQNIVNNLASSTVRIEARTSVVHTRVYIGVTNTKTDEHYIIQVDKTFAEVADVRS